MTVPKHMQRFGWYLPHLRWLGKNVDADAMRADLRGADLRDADLRDADLSDADLSGADLRGADLRRITLCGATIDGVVLQWEHIGGPGHILCALTDAEWEAIKASREAQGT